MTKAVTDFDALVKYYGERGIVLGAHFSFNTNLVELKNSSNASDVEKLINDWSNSLPNRFTSNWMLGDHDYHRIASTAGNKTTDGLNMLTAFLPGIMVTYNGEEIGMEDGYVSYEDGVDRKEDPAKYPLVTRDFQRTPFQWNNTKLAGFSDGNKTWLPVSDKYVDCNVEDQTPDPKSHLNIYREIQSWRSSFAALNETQTKTHEDGKILHITRSNSSVSFDFIFNINEEEIEVSNVTDTAKFLKSSIILTSGNSDKKFSDTFNSSSLRLNPYEAVIVMSTTDSAVSAVLNYFSLLLIFGSLLFR